MERILDLGCGAGDSWRGLRVGAGECRVFGIDIALDRLGEANARYRSQGCAYACARGEDLPFAEGSFHGVTCNVALPYMHIPRVLAELHRVLVPGGWIRLTLHAPSFTWGELRRCFPKPKQSLFRGYVMLNGVLLHFTGKVIPVGKFCESCQTETGMRIALGRAGFGNAIFSRQGEQFLMEARREGDGLGSRTASLMPAS